MYERNVSQIEEIVKKQNQWRGSTLNLIASENVLSNRARASLGSDFAHRYAEGHPGERYYQAFQFVVWAGKPSRVGANRLGRGT